MSLFFGENNPFGMITSQERQVPLATAPVDVVRDIIAMKHYKFCNDTANSALQAMQRTKARRNQL